MRRFPPDVLRFSIQALVTCSAIGIAGLPQAAGQRRGGPRLPVVPLLALAPAGATENPGAAAQPTEEVRAQIEAAIPEKAPVTAARPRRLLIYDVNVGYPGHPSRFVANWAFQRMGEKTGAFEAVVSRDPEVFRPENLRQFDAVLLNNTVGNLFEDPALRQSLAEFVYAGGGLLGIHGTTVAFTRWTDGAQDDWPEFGRMLGARGAAHRESDERVMVKLDSPDHPLNRPFPSQGFEYRDEFFRVHDPYSRDRLRVLFSIDTQQTDLDRDGRTPERADQDYALSWVRSYGRGRVCYCTIGHHPRVFWDPLMLQFYLHASQFVLGDLAAPTTPSNRLSPAVLRQEAWGWKLGITAYTFHKYTMFETIDKTAALGLSYLGALNFQTVSAELNKPFNCDLTDAELQRVRTKLDSAGVRLITCFYDRIPGDEAGCRRVFEFARKMGIQTLISEPPREALDTIERFCDEYDIQLAIHNHDQAASPDYWSPEAVLRVCQNRSRRVGACPDLGYWIRSGIDPVEGIRALGDRLITLQMHDLHEASADGHDVPWGTGEGRVEAVLAEIHRQGLAPALFGLEYSYDWLDSLPEIAASAKFFHEATLRLPDSLTSSP